ncbi:hypothetical protein M3J09_002284 [Ascochyta lentis]
METQHHDYGSAHQEFQSAEEDGSCFPATQKVQSVLRVYSCLPWELRDYIHTYCVQGSLDNEVVVRHASGSKPAFLVRQSFSTHSYQWIEDPVFLHLSPGRIGPSVAREVLAAYYKTRTFKFAHRELGLLQAFLETDRFGLGIRPADHVRHVDLQIQPSLYAQLHGFKSKDEEIAKCCRALGALSVIQRSRTTVAVHVDLAEEFLGDEDHKSLIADAAEFVFQVAGVVNDLKLDGLRIDLIFEGEWDKANVLRMCNRSVTSLDDFTSQIKTACI